MPLREFPEVSRWSDQLNAIEAWRNPWTWPVRPPDDRGAWICAAVVFAAGLAAFTVRGARTRLADS